jgi:hypothetical protein
MVVAACYTRPRIEHDYADGDHNARNDPLHYPGNPDPDVQDLRYMVTAKAILGLVVKSPSPFAFLFALPPSSYTMLLTVSQPYVLSPIYIYI